MQVRCLVLDHEGEQLGEIHYNPPAAREIPAVFQGIMATISDNLQVVTARIARAARAAGRDPFSVTLLAVSKSQPVARIEEARAAGHKAFGENYVQEALEKMDALPGLEWHLIGPLQSNKTRIAAERFAWVHTLEREKIARRLSEQRRGGRPARRCPASRRASFSRSSACTQAQRSAAIRVLLLRSGPIKRHSSPGIT